MTDPRRIEPGPDHPITVTPTGRPVEVRVNGRVVARSSAAQTLQEASYPPVQYVPVADVDAAVLSASDHTSYCPYKGEASYYRLTVDGADLGDAVWFYRQPYDAVAAVADHVAFYPDRAEVVVG